MTKSPWPESPVKRNCNPPGSHWKPEDEASNEGTVRRTWTREGDVVSDPELFVTTHW